jgi:hypothetical protein
MAPIWPKLSPRWGKSTRPQVGDFQVAIRALGSPAIEDLLLITVPVVSGISYNLAKVEFVQSSGLCGSGLQPRSTYRDCKPLPRKTRLPTWTGMG